MHILQRTAVLLDFPEDAFEHREAALMGGGGISTSVTGAHGHDISSNNLCGLGTHEQSVAGIDRRL